MPLSSFLYTLLRDFIYTSMVFISTSIKFLTRPYLVFIPSLTMPFRPIATQKRPLPYTLNTQHPPLNTDIYI